MTICEANKPMTKMTFRTLFLIWLAWAVIVVGFQALSTARIIPQWPDRSQKWTVDYTGSNYQVGRPYLVDPFMNDQVAWDSEYYLGIATGGYNDPKIPHLTSSGVSSYADGHMVVGGAPYTGDPGISLAYAFFPFYPWMIWLFHWPLLIFGLDPIATSTLAGVIVSALGTLGAMLALYDLTYKSLDHESGIRAAFYLLIFPTGFFLIQVYTEGLFVGLAFGCLAMLRRGGWYWVPAALLGAAATLTRAVGVALIIPMALNWFRTGDWMNIDLEWRQIHFLTVSAIKNLTLAARKLIRGSSGTKKTNDPDWSQINRELAMVRLFAISFGKMILAFSPLIAFLIWKFSYLGLSFDFIESTYFGRGVLNFGAAFFNWATAFQGMFAGIPQQTAYFITEFIGLLVGIVTCIACIKRNPELAWFSLAVLVISWGSGPAQGIQRYILAAPAVFYMLAHWGRNPAFDRAWTIFSTILMGFLAMLFAFNMWVA